MQKDDARKAPLCTTARSPPVTKLPTRSRGAPGGAPGLPPPHGHAALRGAALFLRSGSGTGGAARCGGGARYLLVGGGRVQRDGHLLLLVLRTVQRVALVHGRQPAGRGQGRRRRQRGEGGGARLAGWRRGSGRAERQQPQLRAQSRAGARAIPAGSGAGREGALRPRRYAAAVPRLCGGRRPGRGDRTAVLGPGLGRHHVEPRPPLPSAARPPAAARREGGDKGAPARPAPAGNGAGTRAKLSWRRRAANNTRLGGGCALTAAPQGPGAAASAPPAARGAAPPPRALSPPPCAREWGGRGVRRAAEGGRTGGRVAHARLCPASSVRARARSRVREEGGASAPRGRGKCGLGAALRPAPRWCGGTGRRFERPVADLPFEGKK